MYFADTCEPGWTYFKGFCYLTSKTCQNWTTARDKCRQENAFLVDVQNNEENVFLQHLHNGKKSWLGFNDIFTEGSFTWADRGTGNFTAWAKNQPNNFRDEDCVNALGVEYKYKWNDVKCGDCHQYTCKKGRIWKIEQIARCILPCEGGWVNEWINWLDSFRITYKTRCLPWKLCITMFSNFSGIIKTILIQHFLGGEGGKQGV